MTAIGLYCGSAKMLPSPNSVVAAFPRGPSIGLNIQGYTKVLLMLAEEPLKNLF